MTTPQLPNSQRPIDSQLRNSQNARAKKPEGLNFKNSIFASYLGCFGRWMLGVNWALGVVALGLVAAASTANAATRYDPRLRFRTLRTPHFDIYAHQGVEALAIRLAHIAERVRARFEPVLGIPRGRVHVILVDQTDQSNGFATPFPYDTIQINAVAPASETLIGNTTDWLELAFTHEYTHILHLDRSLSLMHGVRAVFGRAPFVFPNLYLPVWQTEGLATFEESHMTGEGRIPAGDFRAIVDTAAPHRRFEPIDRASGGLVDWPSGLAAYAYGAYFHQYLADRYGEDGLSRLADATAGRVPLFGNGAFKNVFGRSTGGLWADFRESRERAARTDSVTDARATRLTHQGFSVTALRASDDGTVRYAVNDSRSFPALMELRPGGTPRRLAWRAEGLRTSVSGDWVVFDQVELVRSVAVYGDLYAVKRGGGPVVRLTRDARAGDPDVSPDSRRIVCTVLAVGHRALALLDFSAASPHVSAPRVIVDEPDSDYTGPRWSPDGRSIVASRRRGGVYEIVLIDPEAKTIREIVARRDARLVTPSWTHDGRTVLFAADLGEGPFNIYAADVESGEARQVTDTAGGAQFPDLSSSGVLTYVGYTTEGYDVFSVRTNPDEWKRIDFASPNQNERNSPNPDNQDLANPWGRYHPLSTLAPTYWEPEIRSDSGETLFGVGTAMYDVLGRHTYAADAAWSGARARPDWRVSYVYDRWRPTLFAAYSDDTDPIRGGDFRARELTTGVLLPFRRIRWSETLMAAFVAENDTIMPAPGVVFADTSRVFRAIRGGWLHDSRRQFGYSIGAQEGFAIEAAAETSRTALGSDSDGGAGIVDVRAFHQVLTRGAVLAARAAFAASWGPEGSRRVFSAAGSGPSVIAFDFGRDTIGLLRGFNPEDVIGSRAAAVNVDLRVPLWYPQRGPGTWPVFLRAVHAAGFVDAGNAWESRFRSSGIRTAAGGELSLDTTLLHSTPITFAAGAAWTRDPVTSTNALSTFGRIGYAF